MNLYKEIHYWHLNCVIMICNNIEICIQYTKAISNLTLLPLSMKYKCVYVCVYTYTH